MGSSSMKSQRGHVHSRVGLVQITTAWVSSWVRLALSHPEDILLLHIAPSSGSYSFLFCDVPGALEGMMAMSTQGLPPPCMPVLWPVTGCCSKIIFWWRMGAAATSRFGDRLPNSLHYNFSCQSCFIHAQTEWSIATGKGIFYHCKW